MRLLKAFAMTRSVPRNLNRKDGTLTYKAEKMERCFLIKFKIWTGLGFGFGLVSHGKLFSNNVMK